MPASFNVLHDLIRKMYSIVVECGKSAIERIVKRLHALSYHMPSYFWRDFQQLNVFTGIKLKSILIIVNKSNVISNSIPDWVFDFTPTRGGYFVGNVSHANDGFLMVLFR